MRWSRRSRNWTSFSSPWARAWDGHEVVDLAVSAHKEADDAPARWPTRNRPSHSGCQGRTHFAALLVTACARKESREFPATSLRQLRASDESDHDFCALVRIGATGP